MEGTCLSGYGAVSLGDWSPKSDKPNYFEWRVGKIIFAALRSTAHVLFVASLVFVSEYSSAF